MKVKLWRRAFAASMSAVMLLGLTACGGSNSTESSDGIKTFTMFTAMPGSEINDDNDVMNIIAEKTGAKLKETWLTGQTDAEAIGTIIAGGEYPDFINGGDAMMSLYDAGVLVPWDDYLEKYPNLKETVHRRRVGQLPPGGRQDLLGQRIPEHLWRRSCHHP